MPQALGLLLFTLGAPVGLVNAAVGVGALGALGSAAIQIGLSIGLSYLGALLTPKPQAPKPSDVKSNIREPTQPRFRSYGLVRVGGAVAFIGKRGNRLFKVICTGQGRINAVLEHWVDDRKVTLDSSGYVTSDSEGLEDNNRCQIEYRLGTESQTAYASLTSRMPDVWTSAHQGNGMPHAVMVLKQPSAETFSKVFPNGVSTKYSQVQESAIVYDPRTGTSVYSNNAALVIRDFLTSPWGLRLSEETIALADEDWIAEANVCDELVPLKGGGTEKRWRIGMTYSLNERPGDVLQRMLDACDGQIFPTADGGLTLKVGRWQAPTVVLDEDTITSISGLTRGGDVLTRFNTIRIQYTSPAHDFEEVDADPWVNEDLVSLYGEVSKDVQIFASPSHGQTRRIAKLIDRRVNPRWRATLSCNLGGLAVIGERFVTVRLPDYGIDESFEIQGQPQFVMGEEGMIIGIQVEVISMDATAYAWDPATEEGTPPPVPDPLEDDDDLPVPVGFVVTTATRNVQGQSLTYATLKATAPVREDYYLYFEVSSDGGGTWAEVQHEQKAMQAEYGPLIDGVTYQARARTISSGKTLSDPTSPVVTFTATSIPPLTPVAFTASGTATVSLSVRAANDANTRALQFRRGTPAQAFSAAAIISDQLANANDVRSAEEAPTPGSWRYWATAKNASGALSTTPAGPIDLVIVGPEMVTNGNFDSDTGWTKGTNWSIASGVATKVSPTTADLSQSQTLVTGATYRVTYTITRTAGTLNVKLAGGTAVLGAARTAAGTYTDDLVATAGNNLLAFQGGNTFAGSVDVVSMKRIA
jgi:hypothetical protein